VQMPGRYPRPPSSMRYGWMTMSPTCQLRRVRAPPRRTPSASAHLKPHGRAWVDGGGWHASDGGTRILPAGSDPWGSLGSREAEYARIEEEAAPKAVVDEKSLQGGRSVAASVETMLRERYAQYASGLGLSSAPLGLPELSGELHTERTLVM